MKVLIYSFIAVALLTFSSCETDEETVVYGATEYYDSFLFKPYEPVKMERYLDLSFNEDAMRILKNKEFIFELRKDGDVEAENIKFYVNDSLCSDNRFSITVNDAEIKLGLEFLSEAEEGTHSYFLKDVTPEGSYFDRITFEGFGKNNSIQVEKIIIMNPMKKGVIIGLVVILIVCVLWYIISRFFIWRSTSFSKVYIDYNDGYGPVAVKMSGCYELICTNDRGQKDSFIAKILKGNRMYVVNDFWVNPVTIKDGYRRNRIQILGSRGYDIVGEEMRREAFEMVNSDNRRVTIETT